MKRNRNYIENLEQWNKIKKYAEWMYSKYQKFIGKRVLDIGSGTGTMINFYIDRVDLAIATDIFPEQLELINQRFKAKKNFKSFYLDVSKLNFQELQTYKFDTIVCINVLEHIKNDSGALKNMSDVLLPEGKIILIVPAHRVLYNYMDENAGHYRRYDERDIINLVNNAGLKIIYNKYFNLLGIPVYYLKGKISKKNNQGGSFSTTLNEKNSKFYNLAANILRPIEDIISVPAGISKIMVLEK